MLLKILMLFPGSKSAIDNINLNQPDKGVHDVNDLNKIDKMGSIGRGYSKDGRNIQMEKAGKAYHSLQ